MHSSAMATSNSSRIRLSLLSGKESEVVRAERSPAISKDWRFLQSIVGRAIVNRALKLEADWKLPKVDRANVRTLDRKPFALHERTLKWKSFYAQDRHVYFEPRIIPRLADWAFGSIPTVCMCLAWQLRYRQKVTFPLDPRSTSQLSRIAIFGLITSIVGDIAYHLSKSQISTIFFGPTARWYLKPDEVAWRVDSC